MENLSFYVVEKLPQEAKRRYLRLEQIAAVRIVDPFTLQRKSSTVCSGNSAIYLQLMPVI